MKMSNRCFVTLLLIVFSLVAFTTSCSPITVSPSPTPTETIPVDAFSINQRLGRGVNLGNALEGYPAEGDWGVLIQEEYLDLIREAGFNSVRIPIRWSAHADENAPDTIDADFLARVDEVTGWALERDLAVVINFHHYDALFLDPNGHEERFLAMWAQVAEHFQDAPPTMVFEILNEPHDSLTPGRWNQMLVEALAVIRENNPDRIVVIGPGEWNGVRALKHLELPEDDRNLIVTFHYYSPFQFTHQGAEWASGSEGWLGTTWEGTSNQKSLLSFDFQIASQWADENDRPIYLGEFGAYEKADIESRAIWTDAVARTAEKYGFSWSYWEFCAGFGIYDPDTETWNEPLVDALIPKE
jgi:endoglucanase